MATKKKKAAPRRRAAKSSPRPRTVKAASGPSIEAVETSSNTLFFVLLFLGLVGLSWLGMRSCSTKPAVPVVASAPVPPAASAPVAAAAASPAPAARSVAAAPTQKPEAPKARPGARRETAGAKASSGSGASSLTFDRSQKGGFEVRCWRTAGDPAQLDVFAPHNRLVRTLKSEAGAAGWIKLEWDGKDSAGKKVAAGLYFLRPSQEAEQSIRDLWVKD